jgi:hypothetical protein
MKMKNAKVNSLFHQQLSTALSTKNTSGLLALAALLLSGLAVPTAASAAITRIAPEQGFTIAAGVSTPIVLKTSPDAACDLRAEGASDKDHSLRFYANSDGYLKIHARSPEESLETRVQLDCTATSGKVTRYPLYWRASSSPSADMPAPKSVMPVPKGSQVRSALSEEEISSLSDQELISRGYPRRPDASAAPDDYSSWKEIVSRPMTLLSSHTVSRSDISHHTKHVKDGTDEVTYNWSGFVTTGPQHTYMNLHGEWNVPEIAECESNNSTYSSVWVGLDGFNLNDLLQAGTESDCYDLGFFGYAANYYAWEELLPNQPSAQQLDLSPNPGDDIFTQVFIGNESGAPDMTGSYFWYEVDDKTQGQYVYTSLKFSESGYYGGSAEWIVERPGLGGDTFAELSDYDWAKMTGAYVWTSSEELAYSQTSNLQELWMYNGYFNGDDNNKLSSATNDGASTIYFQWHNFH